jgi:serine/threonine protein kinase
MKTLREIRTLERVHHQNIVSYKHSWIEMCKISDFGPSVPCLFLLMEYADCGTLADIIWPDKKQEKLPRQESSSKSIQSSSSKRRRKQGQASAQSSTVLPLTSEGYLHERDIWRLFRDIVKGLRYLHRAGIIHRDLKCENSMYRCLPHNSSTLIQVTPYITLIANINPQPSTPLLYSTLLFC